MKQHLSVLYVSARATICRVLLLLGLMAVTEGVLFYALRSRWQDTLPFSEAVRAAGVPIVCAICFALMCVLLVAANLMGSKTEFTVERLSVTTKGFIFWQGAYNSVCLLAFWAVQALTVLGLSAFYLAAVDPAGVGPQSRIFAFYTGAFLHALLPLKDLACTVRNLLLLPALGMAMAGESHHLRRGSIPCFGLLAVALAAVNFAQSAADYSRGEIIAAVTAALAAAAVATALSRGGLPDEA